jgi:hypothetical protein
MELSKGQGPMHHSYRRQSARMSVDQMFVVGRYQLGRHGNWKVLINGQLERSHAGTVSESSILNTIVFPSVKAAEARRIMHPAPRQGGDQRVLPSSRYAL